VVAAHLVWHGMRRRLIGETRASARQRVSDKWGARSPENRRSQPLALGGVESASAYRSRMCAVRLARVISSVRLRPAKTSAAAGILQIRLKTAGK
jgi:hypothetical protein